MATVSLSFTALPEHVRTARLVASAVARRVGLEDDALESIRLAVGEACARAVGRTRAADIFQPVEVEICDEPGSIIIRVRDHAPEADPDELERLSLTLVEGLAHQVEVEPVSSGEGSRLRLSWYL